MLFLWKVYILWQWWPWTTYKPSLQHESRQCVCSIVFGMTWHTWPVWRRLCLQYYNDVYVISIDNVDIMSMMTIVLVHGTGRWQAAYRWPWYLKLYVYCVWWHRDDGGNGTEHPSFWYCMCVCVCVFLLWRWWRWWWWYLNRWYILFFCIFIFTFLQFFFLLRSSWSVVQLVHRWWTTCTRTTYIFFIFIVDRWIVSAILFSWSRRRAVMFGDVGTGGAGRRASLLATSLPAGEPVAPASPWTAMSTHMFTVLHALHAQ